MPTYNEYADIAPVNPRNPFRNPTEEPDYTPDYREVLPEIDLPECKLELMPSAAERTGIRRYFSMTFLTLLFAFFISATCFTALRLILTAVLRQVDLRAVGDLPENYLLIADQYMQDSAVGIAVTLISFLAGNLTAFAVGCKLTGVQPRTLFQTRELRAVHCVLYGAASLWIQMLTGLLADGLISVSSRAGFPLTAPESFGVGSAMRTMAYVLYGCIIAPVTEELLLRGFALKNLSRVSQRFGILMTAFLFGVMHENVLQFLFTFPLGILLGYITIRHNSVLPAIAVHITVNAVSVLMDLMKDVLPLGTFRTVNMVYMLTVLVLGTVAVLFLLATERLPDNTPHQNLRGMRIALTSPLFSALLAVHIVSALLNVL